MIKIPRCSVHQDRQLIPVQLQAKVVHFEVFIMIDSWFLFNFMLKLYIL